MVFFSSKSGSTVVINSDLGLKMWVWGNFGNSEENVEIVKVKPQHGSKLRAAGSFFDRYC